MIDSSSVMLKDLKFKDDGSGKARTQEYENNCDAKTTQRVLQVVAKSTGHEMPPRLDVRSLFCLKTHPMAKLGFKMRDRERDGRRSRR